MAVERMVQAGARPITTWAYVSELQRTGHMRQPPRRSPNCSHGGAALFGQGLLWEWDLLNLKAGTR
jgi:hypothetical protein